MREAVKGGLTAEAAVERVQNATRARMLRQHDSYWRERQRDLDDLSDRLLRILAGSGNSAMTSPANCRPIRSSLRARWGRPSCSTTTARGCAASSSRTAAARATSPSSPRRWASPPSGRPSGIDRARQRRRCRDHRRRSGRGASAPLAAKSSPPISDKVRFRARRQKQYQALRDVPAVTKDGVRIALHMNAGLLVDMPHLAESGADGIGLFRTELQFMLSETLSAARPAVAALSRRAR